MPTMKKKSFLVTGGTGFIGSGISERLVQSGHKVTIFDNNSRGKISRIEKINKKIKFIKGDIRDKKSVLKTPPLMTGFKIKLCRS